MSYFRGAVLMCAFAATAARADIVSFDFDGVAAAFGEASVTSYMTSIYGSAVTATDTVALTNANVVQPEYMWNGNDTRHLRNAVLSGGDFEISFDDAPITGFKFSGYVFRDSGGIDFGYAAYDSTYVDRETPGVTGLVDFDLFIASAGTQIDSGWIMFPSPVSLLVFSDSLVSDVGVDNLMVIPAPGAALLAVLGLGGIGALKRRRKLE